jgi:predicted NBD/HSP70 family sugar kinase
MSLMDACPKKQLHGKSIQDVKLENRSLIFEGIRASDEISRADLARATGLTAATISNIVNELIDTGLITEAGLGNSTGGRPPALLKVNSHFGYVLGVSLTRSWISAVLTGLDLKDTIYRTIVDYSLLDSGKVTAQTLLSIVHNVIEESGIPREKILGIGVSCPGPLDAANGVLISPPNFPGWTNVPLCQIIEEEFGIRAILDNDANACALAEKWFGAARDMKNFAYIESDTGVGAGIVIDGNLYVGEHNVAGEIGHTTIDLNGPRCGCGNIGCLELYASPKAAVKGVQAALQAGQTSLVQEWIGENVGDLSYQTIVRAAERGDPVSSQAIKSMAQALSAGVINLIHSLDLEAVFIGGAICEASDALFNTVRQNVNDRCMTEETRQTPILPSQLGTEAPIIGALSLVLREVICRLELNLADGGFSPLPLHQRDDR